MNEQEVESIIDELTKLTQQRDELNEQIIKLKIKIFMKQIKNKGEH